MTQADKEYLLEKKRVYARARYAKHRDEETERVRKWRLKNSKSSNATSRKYWAENKETISAQRKKHRLENKKLYEERNNAWLQVNRGYANNYSKKYYRNNKAKCDALTAKRSALKRTSTPDLFKNCPVEKQRIINIFNLRNLITFVTGVQHHVDHMWPLSDGGPHWSGNLQIITAKENLTKHAYVCPELKRNIKEAMLVELHGTAEINAVEGLMTS
jgi:hypothetical protein